MKPCRIENCINPHYCNDLCKKHYDKNRRHGDPLFERTLKQPVKCNITTCQNIAVRRNGMCAKHYINWQRHGDATFVNPKCNRDGNYKLNGLIKILSLSNGGDNATYYNAYLQASKKRTRQATPPWLDKNELIKFIRNCPKGCHVDHIIPITNPLVSGLNVPWNLQYLTKYENLSKGNKFDSTYNNESWRKPKKAA